MKSGGVVENMSGGHDLIYAGIFQKGAEFCLQSFWAANESIAQHVVDCLFLEAGPERRHIVDGRLQGPTSAADYAQDKLPDRSRETVCFQVGVGGHTFTQAMIYGSDKIFDGWKCCR